MKKLLFIILIMLVFACEDEYFSDVPNVKFSTTFYLDGSDFFQFDIGTSIAFDEEAGGYAGIILYYAAENIIYAYDHCCPIHHEDKEQLILDGAIAICPTDSIAFSLTETDYVISDKDGNSACLKSYKSYLNGNTLTVSN